MYARVVTLSIGAEGFDRSIEYFEQKVIPGVQDLPGYRGTTFLVNRYDHVTRSLTYWATPADLEASAETAGQLHHDLTSSIEGVQVISVEVYEVAVFDSPSPLN